MALNRPCPRTAKAVDLRPARPDVARPAAELAADLRRVSVSLANLVRRGGTLRSQRGQGLCDRYNDLRAALRSTDEGADLWEAFCAERGFCSSHDGYDCFA